MATLILRLNPGDHTVFTYAQYLMTGNAPATIITISGGLNRLGDMTHGDRLFIIGHGSTSTIGGYSAEAMATILANNKLPSGIGIILVACQSGSSGDPFALELKTSLVNKKIIPGYVSGGTNNMRVKPDGTPYTKTPGPAGTEIHTGIEIVNTPWGPRTHNINPTYITR